MALAPRPKRRTGDFGGGGGGGGRKYTPRRKVCTFCVDKIPDVDYKDLGRLRRFLSERGKIEPRRKTGTCAPHQRSLNTALKRARHLALLPYTAEHIRITGMVIRDPNAGPRGPRGPRPPMMETQQAPEQSTSAAPADSAAAPADSAATETPAAESAAATA